MPSGRYDHSQVDLLCDKLIEFGVQQTTKNLVICCTVMPGYTDIIAEKMREYNYTVSYNPEFIAQGTVLRDQAQPDIVLIGEGSETAGNIIQEIYERHTTNEPTICRMKPIEAEIAKISLNCYCTTKIAFANMVGDIVLNSGGNPDVVLNAIGSDSRINHKYLGYGFGYGGPCFPRDNRALSIYANDIECPAKISIATDESNDVHFEMQVKRFQEENKKGTSVTIDSVAYKKGTTILEESQQLKYAIRLAELGYRVTIKDYKEVIDFLKRSHDDLFIYEEIDYDNN